MSSIYGGDPAERKMLRVFTVLCHYFPKAMREVTRVCVAGNAQHNPGEPLHWVRGKSMDQMNALFHHMVDHEMGEVFDQTDPPEILAAVDGKPLYSMAKGAWRALAELELTIEREEEKDTAEPHRNPDCRSGVLDCDVQGVHEHRGGVFPWNVDPAQPLPENVCRVIDLKD
jgi:hypothetical protein